MMESIISLKIAPEIHQQLEVIKQQLETKAEEALSLVCTESTIKDVKKVRTEIRKYIQDLESQRKDLKTEYMKPYDEFHLLYKNTTLSLTHAETVLKQRIDTVTHDLLQEKVEKLQSFMAEKATELGISWLTWNQISCDVKASTSEKSYRKEITQILEKVAQDVVVIDSLENKDLVSHFFMENLNLAHAISCANAQEESKAKALAQLAETTAQAELDSLVEAENQALLAQETDPDDMEPVLVNQAETDLQTDLDPLLTLQFTVRANKSKLLALKQFLIDGGYDYE